VQWNPGWWTDITLTGTPWPVGSIARPAAAEKRKIERHFLFCRDCQWNITLKDLTDIATAAKKPDGNGEAGGSEELMGPNSFTRLSPVATTPHYHVDPKW
jgi:hypothetical protein